MMICMSVVLVDVIFIIFLARSNGGDRALPVNLTVNVYLTVSVQDDDVVIFVQDIGPPVIAGAELFQLGHRVLTPSRLAAVVIEIYGVDGTARASDFGGLESRNVNHAAPLLVVALDVSPWGTV